MTASTLTHDSVGDYLTEIGQNEVLSREEERELFRRLEEGEESARERILACNLRFVVKIALQFRERGLPLEDLIQEGNIGLLEVIDKFDWRKGFRFSTYAAFWIRQSIQRALVRTGSLVRLPTRKARLLGQIAQVIEDHHVAHHRDPSVEEMADATDVTTETLSTVLGYRHGVLSLDTPVDEEGAQLMDVVADDESPSPRDHTMTRERCEGLDRALDRLSVRERAVLRLRFGFETGKALSLRNTSVIIGLSQEGVRRLERIALSKLRRRAHTQELACLL